MLRQCRPCPVGGDIQRRLVGTGHESNVTSKIHQRVHDVRDSSHCRIMQRRLLAEISHIHVAWCAGVQQHANEGGCVELRRGGRVDRQPTQVVGDGDVCPGLQQQLRHRRVVVACCVTHSRLVVRARRVHVGAVRQQNGHDQHPVQTDGAVESVAGRPSARLENTVRRMVVVDGVRSVAAEVVQNNTHVGGFVVHYRLAQRRSIVAHGDAVFLKRDTRATLSDLMPSITIDCVCTMLTFCNYKVSLCVLFYAYIFGRAIYQWCGFRDRHHDPGSPQSRDHHQQDQCGERGPCDRSSNSISTSGKRPTVIVPRLKVPYRSFFAQSKTSIKVLSSRGRASTRTQ